MLLTSRNPTGLGRPGRSRSACSPAPRACTFLRKRVPTIVRDGRRRGGRERSATCRWPSSRPAPGWRRPACRWHLPRTAGRPSCRRCSTENPPPGYERTAAATWLLSLQRLRDRCRPRPSCWSCARSSPRSRSRCRLLYSERFVERPAAVRPGAQRAAAAGPADPGDRPVRAGPRRLGAGQHPAAPAGAGRHPRSALRSRAGGEPAVTSTRCWPRPTPRTPTTRPTGRCTASCGCTCSAAGALESRSGAVRQLVIDMVRYLWRCTTTSSEELARDAMVAWRALASGEPTTCRRCGCDSTWPIALRSQAKYHEAFDIDEERLRSSWWSGQGADHPYTIMSGQWPGRRPAGRWALPGGPGPRRGGARPGRRTFGEDHRRTLNAVNNLAVSLRMVGDFAAATQLDEETLRRPAAHLRRPAPEHAALGPQLRPRPARHRRLPGGPQAAGVHRGRLP